MLAPLRRPFLTPTCHCVLFQILLLFANQLSVSPVGGSFAGSPPAGALQPRAFFRQERGARHSLATTGVVRSRVSADGSSALEVDVRQAQEPSTDTTPSPTPSTASSSDANSSSSNVSSNSSSTSSTSSTNTTSSSTTAATAEGAYTLGEQNSETCSKGLRTTDARQCENAATAMGLVWDSANEESASSPRGCFQRTTGQKANAITFNPATATPDTMQGRPVCMACVYKQCKRVRVSGASDSSVNGLYSAIETECNGTSYAALDGSSWEGYVNGEDAKIVWSWPSDADDNRGWSIRTATRTVYVDGQRRKTGTLFVTDGFASPQGAGETPTIECIAPIDDTAAVCTQGRPLYLTSSHGMRVKSDATLATSSSSPNLRWKFVDAGNSEVYIVAMDSNNVLEDTGVGTPGMTTMQDELQKWTIVDANDDGKVFFVSSRSERLADDLGQTNNGSHQFKMTTKRGDDEKWIAELEDGESACQTSITRTVTQTTTTLEVADATIRVTTAAPEVTFTTRTQTAAPERIVTVQGAAWYYGDAGASCTQTCEGLAGVDGRGKGLLCNELVLKTSLTTAATVNATLKEVAPTASCRSSLGSAKPWVLDHAPSRCTSASCCVTGYCRGICTYGQVTSAASVRTCQAKHPHYRRLCPCSGSVSCSSSGLPSTLSFGTLNGVTLNLIAGAQLGGEMYYTMDRPAPHDWLDLLFNAGSDTTVDLGYKVINGTHALQIATLGELQTYADTTEMAIFQGYAAGMSPSVTFVWAADAAGAEHHAIYSTTSPAKSQKDIFYGQIIFKVCRVTSSPPRGSNNNTIARDSNANADMAKYPEVPEVAMLFGGQRSSGTTENSTIATYLYDPAERDLVAYSHTMPQQLTYMSGAWIRGQLFVFGDARFAQGDGAVGGYTYAYKFDTVFLQWTALPTMQRNTRAEAAAGAADGLFVVIGGCINITCDAASADGEMFDPVTSTWSWIRDMPDVRRGHSAVEWNGELFVAGGTTYGATETSATGSAGLGVYAFNPSSETWRSLAPLDMMRNRMAVGCLYDGRIIVAGGANQVTTTTTTAMTTTSVTATTTDACFDVPLNDDNGYKVECATQSDKCVSAGAARPTGWKGKVYDSCRKTCGLCTSASSAQSLLLQMSEEEGRRVAAAGGGRQSLASWKLQPPPNGEVITSSVLLYDPLSNTWSKGPDMSRPRAMAAFAFVRGKFFVAGGYTSGVLKPSEVTGEAEEYDPDTNSWSPAPSLVQPIVGAGAAVIQREGTSTTTTLYSTTTTTSSGTTTFTVTVSTTNTTTGTLTNTTTTHTGSTVTSTNTSTTTATRTRTSLTSSTSTTPTVTQTATNTSTATNTTSTSTQTTNTTSTTSFTETNTTTRTVTNTTETTSTSTSATTRTSTTVTVWQECKTYQGMGLPLNEALPDGDPVLESFMTLEKCCERCADNMACSGFVFKNPLCYLKGGVLEWRKDAKNTTVGGEPKRTTTTTTPPTTMTTTSTTTTRFECWQDYAEDAAKCEAMKPYPAVTPTFDQMLPKEAADFCDSLGPECGGFLFIYKNGTSEPEARYCARGGLGASTAETWKPQANVRVFKKTPCGCAVMEDASGFCEQYDMESRKEVVYLEGGEKACYNHCRYRDWCTNFMPGETVSGLGRSCTIAGPEGCTAKKNDTSRLFSLSRSCLDNEGPDREGWFRMYASSPSKKSTCLSVGCTALNISGPDAAAQCKAECKSEGGCNVAQVCTASSGDCGNITVTTPKAKTTTTLPAATAGGNATTTSAAGAAVDVTTAAATTAAATTAAATTAAATTAAATTAAATTASTAAAAGSDAEAEFLQFQEQQQQQPSAAAVAYCCKSQCSGTTVNNVDLQLTTMAGNWEIFYNDEAQLLSTTTSTSTTTGSTTTTRTTSTRSTTSKTRTTQTSTTTETNTTTGTTSTSTVTNTTSTMTTTKTATSTFTATTATNTTTSATNTTTTTMTNTTTTETATASTETSTSSTNTTSTETITTETTTTTRTKTTRTTTTRTETETTITNTSSSTTSTSATTATSTETTTTPTTTTTTDTTVTETSTLTATSTETSTTSTVSTTTLSTSTLSSSTITSTTTRSSSTWTSTKTTRTTTTTRSTTSSSSTTPTSTSTETRTTETITSTPTTTTTVSSTSTKTTTRWTTRTTTTDWTETETTETTTSSTETTSTADTATTTSSTWGVDDDDGDEASGSGSADTNTSASNGTSGSTSASTAGDGSSAGNTTTTTTTVEGAGEGYVTGAWNVEVYDPAGFSTDDKALQRVRKAVATATGVPEDRITILMACRAAGCKDSADEVPEDPNIVQIQWSVAATEAVPKEVVKKNLESVDFAATIQAIDAQYKLGVGRRMPVDLKKAGRDAGAAAREQGGTPAQCGKAAGDACRAAGGDPGQVAHAAFEAAADAAAREGMTEAACEQEAMDAATATGGSLSDVARASGYAAARKASASGRSVGDIAAAAAAATQAAGGSQGDQAVIAAEVAAQAAMGLDWSPVDTAVAAASAAAAAGGSSEEVSTALGEAASRAATLQGMMPEAAGGLAVDAGKKYNDMQTQSDQPQAANANASNATNSSSLLGVSLLEGGQVSSQRPSKVSSLAKGSRLVPVDVARAAGTAAAQASVAYGVSPTKTGKAAFDAAKAAGASSSNATLLAGQAAAQEAAKRGQTPGEVLKAAKEAVKMAGGSEEDLNVVSQLAAREAAQAAAQVAATAERKAGGDSSAAAQVAAEAAMQSILDSQVEMPPMSIAGIALEMAKSAGGGSAGECAEAAAVVAEEASKRTGASDHDVIVAAAKVAKEAGASPTEIAEIAGRAAAKLAKEGGKSRAEVIKTAVTAARAAGAPATVQAKLAKEVESRLEGKLKVGVPDPIGFPADAVAVSAVQSTIAEVCGVPIPSVHVTVRCTVGCYVGVPLVAVPKKKEKRNETEVFPRTKERPSPPPGVGLLEENQAGEAMPPHFGGMVSVAFVVDVPKGMNIDQVLSNLRAVNLIRKIQNIRTGPVAAGHVAAVTAMRAGQPPALVGKAAADATRADGGTQGQVTRAAGDAAGMAATAAGMAPPDVGRVAGAAAKAAGGTHMGVVMAASDAAMQAARLYGLSDQEVQRAAAAASVAAGGGLGGGIPPDFAAPTEEPDDYAGLDDGEQREVDGEMGLIVAVVAIFLAVPCSILVAHTFISRSHC
eukprot:TRINITY_DN6912_c1_g2_i1.p1 TRINITY_DN6912_c1_g2~~TRINITY_DN6912_c1_g2_i1.p1  ORF type:complete len:3170 (+),score=750.56 TRINITY_DN6912_c1_g2_i1:140-9649(+)